MDARAKVVAMLVREAYPLRYVSVKPYPAMPSMVMMRRGRGPWGVYTVTEALATKRAWRMQTMRERKARKA